ncbi:hypothetical protein ENUP19_0240G0057 [Entamoeba nuttalli]|uniref:40S ribosomal protein S30 n=1 Tax=Entamoeba nuttalli TaxID=412467 RepID=A0ABQ0DQB2_9EUKA
MFGSRYNAGKVRRNTPKVKKSTKRRVNGRAHLRKLYNQRQALFNDDPFFEFNKNIK